MALFRYSLMFTAIFFLFICTTQTTGAESEKISGLVKLKSNLAMEETVAALQKAIKDKGLTLFTTIDHSANAGKAEMDLPPTMVVIFGNPKLGTPLMQIKRTLAIDLPQKMLVWQDEKEQVWIAYNSAEYLAHRHNISEMEYFQKIAGALEGLARTAAGK